MTQLLVFIECGLSQCLSRWSSHFKTGTAFKMLLFLFRFWHRNSGKNPRRLQTVQTVNVNTTRCHKGRYWLLILPWDFFIIMAGFDFKRRKLGLTSLLTTNSDCCDHFGSRFSKALWCPPCNARFSREKRPICLKIHLDTIRSLMYISFMVN